MGRKRELAGQSLKVQPVTMTDLDHVSTERRRGNGHAAEVSIRIGARTTFDAAVTSAGLLSVGALVSGILLSTAVIVFAAGRNAGRHRPTPRVGDDR